MYGSKRLACFLFLVRDCCYIFYPSFTFDPRTPVSCHSRLGSPHDFWRVSVTWQPVCPGLAPSGDCFLAFLFKPRWGFNSWIEQQPSKLKVTRSNPVGCLKKVHNEWINNIYQRYTIEEYSPKNYRMLSPRLYTDQIKPPWFLIEKHSCLLFILAIDFFWEDGLVADT
jgi:hypothetical protein